MRVRVERESSGFVMLFPDPGCPSAFLVERVRTDSGWSRAVASGALDALERRGLERRSVRFVHCVRERGWLVPQV